MYVDLVAKLMERYGWVADKVHRRKMAREAARAVLPNATETKIVVTANARAWRTMLELRSSEGAELEIRRMAVAVAASAPAGGAGIFFRFRDLYGGGSSRGGEDLVSQSLIGPMRVILSEAKDRFRAMQSRSFGCFDDARQDDTRVEENHCAKNSQIVFCASTCSGISLAPHVVGKERDALLADRDSGG